VIDLYSRRILGYAMGERHDAGLVVAALNMAAVTRGGQVAGVIFHSDRGSEYCSTDFTRACARWKVRQSMGRVGSCFDNAVTEATFSTLKVEHVHRRQFRTRTEARLKIATWITGFTTSAADTPSATGNHPPTTNDHSFASWRTRPHNATLHDSRGLTALPVFMKACITVGVVVAASAPSDGRRAIKGRPAAPGRPACSGGRPARRSGSARSGEHVARTHRRSCYRWRHRPAAVAW
jgi:integrase-like protein